MKIRTLLIAIVALLAFASCSTEKKLAKRFVEESTNIHAAVYFPEQAKVTLVQDDKGDFSKVLDSLDQNAFLDIMYAAYAEGLRSYGVDVYIPEDPDKVVVDSLNWLVVLSQVEIQARITPYEDEFFDMVSSYQFTVPLNTVNVAAWFDINNGEWLRTQYYEHNLMEDFNSSVSIEENGIKHHYEVDTIEIADVYNYSVFLGKRYAEYTYSLMMNKFIESEMKKENASPMGKVMWDPKTKSYYYLDDEEGFIELLSF